MFQDANITDVPHLVNNIIGKTCVFQIKVTPYNINHGCEEYTVTRVSECPTTSTGASCSDGNMKKKQKLA